MPEQNASSSSTMREHVLHYTTSWRRDAWHTRLSQSSNTSLSQIRDAKHNCWSYAEHCCGLSSMTPGIRRHQTKIKLWLVVIHKDFHLHNIHAISYHYNYSTERTYRIRNLYASCAIHVKLCLHYCLSDHNYKSFNTLTLVHQNKYRAITTPYPKHPIASTTKQKKDKQTREVIFYTTPAPPQSLFGSSVSSFLCNPENGISNPE